MKDQCPHIVIVGAGFGGLAAARHLRRLPVRVTLIDRHNYHMFQPLLYQVACAALSPSEIATPIRSLFSRWNNIGVIMDEVTAIDPEAREVRGRNKTFSYDYLVLAPGSEDSYFGREEWKEHTYGLKSLADAIAIRQGLLQRFERAETTDDPLEKKALTTFVLVGGGPTGVEMAGAIAELSRLILARDFRHVDPLAARIMLLEAGPRILSGFPDALADAAEKALRARGVEVLTNTKVEAVKASGVCANGHFIPAALVIWAAGVKATGVTTWLAGIAERGRGGKVRVAEDLSLPAAPEIFVIGDAAEARDAKGNTLPAVAPVAKQQGKFVARVIAARLKNKPSPRRFAYRNYGDLATVGRFFAVANFGWIRFKGRLAWILWGIVHVYYLIGFRNRLSVMANWLWEYLLFWRGSRLIITEDKASVKQPASE